MLYYTMQYSTILCYTLLYYTILCYTILYYILLYYTILHYTIPCTIGHDTVPALLNEARRVTVDASADVRSPTLKTAESSVSSIAEHLGRAPMAEGRRGPIGSTRASHHTRASRYYSVR